jgi:hypothetical protein
LAFLKKIFESLIGFFGRAETRKLTHRPKLPAIPCSVNAPRVREFTGLAYVGRWVYISNIVGSVEPIHFVQ